MKHNPRNPITPPSMQAARNSCRHWLVLVVSCMGLSSGFAATTWDSDTVTTSIQDGGGIWDTTTPNWWNGTANVVWPNNISSTATLGAASGAAGDISVSGTVTLNKIQFNTPSSGSYTLKDGILSIGGTTPTVTLASGASATINSVIGEATTGNPLKLAGNSATTSTLTLGGANTYTVATSIVAATVNFNNLQNGGVTSSFGMGDNTVGIAVSAGSSSQSIVNYIGSGGSTDRPWTINGAYGTTTAGNTINNNGSGAISFNHTGLAVAGTAGSRTLSLGGTYTATANTFAEQIADMTGFKTVLKIAGNTWTLTGANTHSGGTSLNSSGRLNIGNAAALGTGTFTSNSASSAFDNTTGADLTVANDLTLSASTTYVGSAHDMTINGKVTVTGGGSRNLTVTANKLILGGQITGDYSLTKLGAGTLVIKNPGTANTIVGTLISAGTLDLDGTSQNLGTVAFGVGTYLVQKGTINAGTSNNFTAATSSGNTSTVSAVLAGSGTLTHSGKGTLILTGANTFSGATTLTNTGTLALADSGSLASSSISLASGSFFNVSALSDYTLGASQTLKGSGTVTGVVNVAGTVSPGSGVGTLTMGDVSFAATGIYACDLSGATCDLLTTTYLTVDPAAKVVFTGTPTAMSYVIATYAAGEEPTHFATDASLPAGYALDYSTPGQIRLVNNSASAYDIWTSNNGLAGGNAAAGADPDKDGMANVLEWVLGGQPNPANANASSTVQVPTLDATTDPANLIFSFRRTDPSLTQPGIVMVVQYGSNVGTWTDVAIPASGSTTVGGVTTTVFDDGFGTGVDEVEVKIPKSLAIGSKLFARLKVSLQ